MEKTPLLNPHVAYRHEQAPKTGRRWTYVLKLSLILLGLLLARHVSNALWQEPHTVDVRPTDVFSWDTTPTLEYLEYRPCYNESGVGFECARLSAPLDHFNKTTDATISLAIIRLPAVVPPEHPRYGGAILLNPGGPGGSGVGFLQRGYKSVLAAVRDGEDHDDSKLYDLISFDPRGVGASTPNINCFSSSLQGWTWALREMQEGVLGSSDAAFGRLWSMSAAAGGSCSLSAAHDPEDIKKFVNTASVAADMIEIIERHGEWREKQVKLASQKQGSSKVPELLKYKPGQEKIQYWGFSYGTFLGMTFASMFPDRIHRFIVDGVVDAEDYIKSLWFDNLADTEKDMESFYEYCAKAGFPACALANRDDQTTAADVKTRVQSILDSLVHNPLPVIGDNPEVISYSDVKYLIFSGLYTPLQSFPFIANAMFEIERGNGSLLADTLRPYHQPFCTAEDLATEALPLRNQSRLSLSHDAMTAVACGDGDPQDGLSREGFHEHWKKLAKLSPTIGPIWALFRMKCAHYTVRPLTRFTGPWVGETSFPVLFIGNQADPVTPVRNAHKMAKGYKDARVLEQESSGHCSTSSPSKCSQQVIYRYFQYGEMPQAGTSCAPDNLPFGTLDFKAQDAIEALQPWMLGDSSMLSAIMPMVR